MSVCETGPIKKKRAATTELNHDNWDDEEEPEEPGVFKQADKAVLQSRVIKKAKRKLPDQGSTTSTFAGFGGFKSSSSSVSFGSISKPGVGSFDFLSKPIVSNNGASTERKCDICKTILKTEECEKCIPIKNKLPIIKSNDWICSSCMVSNKEDIDKCVCCQTSKPVKSTTSSAKWTCDSCMVPNASTDEKCICCETAKPGSAKKPDSNGNSKPISTGCVIAPSGGFKFVGSSTAPSNASSGFNFGSSSKENTKSEGEKESGFKFGVSKTTTDSGFKFGSSTSDSKNDSGFKFGSFSKESEGGTGFKFGSSSSESKLDGGIKFGSSDSNLKPSSPKIIESKTPNESKSLLSETNNDSSIKSSPISSGFSFGSVSKESKTDSPSTPSDSHRKYVSNLRSLNKQVVKWIKSHVDENPNVILTPIFEDYRKHLQEIELKYPPKKSVSSVLKSTPEESTPENAKPSFSFGSAASKNVKIDSPVIGGAVFGSSLGSNTEDKVSFNTGSSSTSAGLSFANTASKSDSDSASKPEEKKKETFSFGSATSMPATNFSFGSKAASEAPSSTGFSFGSGSSNFKFGSTAPSLSSGAPPTSSSLFFSGLSSTNSLSTQSKPKTEETENVGEDEPPKVEVSVVEEENAFHSVRCKLFYKNDKAFTEKGLGMLHLKKIDEKLQFVLRADTNLGNILLNVLINDKMVFTQRSNNVQFVTVPNPPIKGIDGPTTFLIKVKNSEIAEKLVSKIKENI